MTSNYNKTTILQHSTLGLARLLVVAVVRARRGRGLHVHVTRETQPLDRVVALATQFDHLLQHLLLLVRLDGAAPLLHEAHRALDARRRVVDAAGELCHFLEPLLEAPSDLKCRIRISSKRIEQ